MDDTVYKQTLEEYTASRPACLIIVIDSYDELFDDMKDSEQAKELEAINSLLEAYIAKSTGFLRKISNSRYIAVVEERDIHWMLQERFEILDQVRALHPGGFTTLSIGVGHGGKTLQECHQMARESIDIALGRGGDQAAVKTVDGFEFYGGISHGVEKRSHVRSRIIANALCDLIKKSDSVIIMGHRMSDLDAIGSAIGVLRICKICGVPAAIAVNSDATLAAVSYTHLVNVLGSTAVAAVTAASKTMNLLTVPLESVGTAMATYSGQNLGAARMDRVRKGVTSALLIATVYSIASALILHFVDVAVMSLFLDTTTEVEIVAMGREYLFWNSVFFVPLGALIVWRYSIQGLGFSTLAMMAGVAEMIARTAVAIVLVPMLGYFGAELANPAAWIAACIFLYPAYRWTCHKLDNRLLAARLHMQNPSPDHEPAL